MDAGGGGSEEVSALEEKVRKLEESLREIREPIERTLIDLRKMLSDLENPFNALLLPQAQGGYQAGVGSTGPELQPTPPAIGGLSLAPFKDEKTPGDASPRRGAPDRGVEASSATEQGAKLDVHEGPMGRLEVKTPLPSVVEPLIGHYGRYLPILACTSILLSLFDEEELRHYLNFYVAKGWVPREVALAVKEALEVVPKDLNSAALRRERRLRVEDHVIAVYLLNKLARDDRHDDIFFLLLLLLKAYGHGAMASGSFLELKDEDRKLFNMG